MKKIVLLGELGKKFGRTHHLAVKNVAEAIRALSANFPGFERHLVESSDRGVGYRLLVGKSALPSVDDMHLPCSDRDVIKIVPVVMGAKSAWTQILIGVAIVAAAFLTGGASIAASGFFVGGVTTTFWGGVALSIGVAMTLGGVAQLLSPVPKADAVNTGQVNSSNSLGSPVNVASQGSAIPVGYGRRIVGSAVISAGLTTQDIPV